MQANDYNNKKSVDEQFVTHAWADMQNRLDEVMPVQKKDDKNRYFLFLFLIFSGFALGIGTMTLLSTSNPVEKTTPREIPPVEIQPIEKRFDGDSKEKEYAVQMNDDSSLEVLSTEENKKQKNNTSNLVKQNNNTNVNSSFVVHEYKNENNNLNVSQISTILPAIQIEEALMIEKENILDLAIVQEIETKEIAPASSLLASLEIDLLEEKEKEDSPLLKEFVDIKKPKKRIRLAAIFGGHTQKFSKVDGLTFGVAVEKELTNKWSLQTGLTYAQLNKDLKNEEEYIQFFDKNPYPPGNAVIVGETEDMISINTIAKTESISNIAGLNYLNLPLNLNYKASPHVRFNLGLQVSYLLNVANKLNLFRKADQTSNVFQNPEMEASNQRTNQSFDNKILLNDGYFNRIDLAGLAGISYHPCQNLGIDLRYNIGLTDFTNDKVTQINIKDRNNSLQLSLLYYFGRAR